MLTKTDIEKYFIAEKQEALLFLIVGIAAIATAVGLIIFCKTNFWRGFAMPLIVLGLIQAIVGFTIYKRSDADRVRVVYARDMNPSELKNKELPKMETVNKNFIVYKWFEIALILTALFLVFKFKANAVCENSWKGNAFWYGLGIALFIQAAFGLGADYFAAKRGKIYENQLKESVANFNKVMQ